MDFPALKSALQEGVKPLEDVPNWQRDRSGAVLNLVDPSLFPLVYGKTMALKVGSKVVGIKDCVTRCGEGEVLTKSDARLDENTCYELEPISLRFQWLPCDVNIEADIAGYVFHCHELVIGLSTIQDSLVYQQLASEAYRVLPSY